MKSTPVSNLTLTAAASLWMNTGCNSLLDIEPHALASLGDASVSVSGETSASRTQLADAALGDGDASSTNGSDASSGQDATSSQASMGDQTNDTLDVTSLGSGHTASTGQVSSGQDSSASSEPADPRTVEPAPPDLSSGVGCASKLDAWGYTSYCRFTPNGFDRNGNPLPDVGDAHVWVYWSDTSVSGWICVIDDGDNGRGLAYRVLVHPEGALLPALPAEDVTPNDVWVLAYEDRDEGAKCAWKAFSASLQADHVMVEWLDLWDANRHFGGRFNIAAP
jgi:hypothetical protein